MSSSAPALNGLVLSGGRSIRMGRDKGALKYFERPDQRTWCYQLLRSVCKQVFISCRKDQEFLVPSNLPRVYDQWPDAGPAGGILSAHLFDPAGAWLVLACDMPGVNSDLLRTLLNRRNPQKAATCFTQGVRVEPLFSIWEPAGLAHLKAAFEKGDVSPARALQSLGCEQIPVSQAESLLSVNTPGEYDQFIVTAE